MKMKIVVGALVSLSLLSPVVLATEEFSVTPYIVGGNDANVAGYPFMASLMFEYASQPGVIYPFCGGSILDSTHILTAAHCVYDTASSQVSNMKVAIEANNGQSMLAAQRIAVKNIYYPSNYDNTTLINDVAVLELSEALPNYTLGHAVPLGDLSDQGYRVVDSIFTIIGYGRLSSTQANTNVDFMEAQVKYVNPTDCNVWANFTTSDKQVCSSGYSFDSSNLVTATCQGDSGGPLVWNGTQIGIVSFGPSVCGQTIVATGTLPAQSVFTDVSQYKDWILKAQRGEVTSTITATTSSSSSGGPISLFGLLGLSLFGYYRKSRAS